MLDQAAAGSTMTTSHVPDLLQRPVVLHVIEAWGGGVVSAVLDYVRSAPHYRHVVLAAPREGHDTGDDAEKLGVTLLRLPTSRAAALRTIAAEYRRLDPAVVHAHSSLAGVLTRLCLVVPRSRIVYTPHCYAFERRDVSVAVRSLFYAVERLLSARTGVAVGCSPREAHLARRLRRRNRDDAAVYVPNVVRLEPRTTKRTAGLTVVAVGRLGAQKGPGYFREVVAAARVLDPSIRWVWLGGGDDAEVAAMARAGVQVSGWLQRTHLLDALAGADIYVHTASWEGAPISALEAAALGLPIVGRAIPAMTSLGFERLAETPAEVAAMILDLRDPEERVRAAGESAAVNERHSPARQVAALERAYAQVAGEATSVAGARRPVRTALPVQAHHVIDLVEIEKRRAATSGV